MKRVDTACLNGKPHAFAEQALDAYRLLSAPCASELSLPSHGQLAGFGTMIIGFLECSCWTFLVGVMQLLTACLIIGWVWSILWGYKLYKLASEPPPMAEP